MHFYLDDFPFCDRKSSQIKMHSQSNSENLSLEHSKSFANAYQDKIIERVIISENWPIS